MSQNLNESDSENTDGYFSDTGSCFGGTTTIAEQMKQRNKDIDDISEHSSDDLTSDSNEEGFIAKEPDKKAKKKAKDPDGTRKKKNKDGQPKDKNKKKDAAKPELKEQPTKPKKDGEVKQAKDGKVKTKAPEVSKQLTKSDKPKKDYKETGKTATIDNSFVSPQKKKKKATNEKTLGMLNPKNAFEQQELFFLNDCQVNPVFEYENIQATQKTMSNFN